MRRFSAERRIIATFTSLPQRSLRLRRGTSDTQDVGSAAAPMLATKTVVVADDTAFVRDRFKAALERHLSPGDFNRRTGPRVVLGIPVAYRFGNTIAAAVTLNISRGGVAVRTTSPLDNGIVVKVRFRMPMVKKDIDVEAKVVWSDRRVGMGLQFSGLAEDDQNAIGEYVDAHFFSNRKA